MLVTVMIFIITVAVVFIIIIVIVFVAVIIITVSIATVLAAFIFLAVFDTNGILTELHIVILYIQTHYMHICMDIHKHSFSNT